MTNKKIIEEALENAKVEEEKEVPSEDSLNEEDKEFQDEAKDLKKMLKSFKKI